MELLMDLLMGQHWDLQKGQSWDLGLVLDLVLDLEKLMAVKMVELMGPRKVSRKVLQR